MRTEETERTLIDAKAKKQAIGEDVFDCLDIQHGIECVAQFTRDRAE